MTAASATEKPSMSTTTSAARCCGGSSRSAAFTSSLVSEVRAGSPSCATRASKACSSPADRAGRAARRRSRSRDAFTTVQSSSAAHGSTTFDVTKPVTGRYVLIWITDLPPLAGSPGKYEALIYDVTVHGFTAGKSG